MGKSKFPGKPSNLAGKKKIRILSQAEISSTSNQQQQQQQQNGATTATNNVSANQNSPNFLEQVSGSDRILCIIA